MKRSPVALWATIAAGLTLVTAPAFAADEGEKIINEVCSQCHSKDQRPLSEQHLTREQWQAALEKMQGLGADIPTSKKKVEALLDYLVRTHGPESH